VEYEIKSGWIGSGLDAIYLKFTANIKMPIAAVHEEIALIKHAKKCVFGVFLTCIDLQPSPVRG
jgi:hypothetical protein